MGIALFTQDNRIGQGLSYWRVKLRSGREFSELDTSFDLLRGTRPVDWALDLVGSGDCGKIAEITLCTPQENVTLPISEPYTAVQLKRGAASLPGGRSIHAQIIARIDNKETGDCTCVIWDVLEQRLYKDFQTSVKQFGAWREGVAPIGALSAEVIGFRLNDGGSHG